MIGTCGFIGSHLCEKLMAETPHVVLAVDVYSDKIRHLVDPPPPHLARHISFHHLNIKNDPRLKGLVKMADLVWDLKNLQCVQTLSEHKAAVTSELCWGQKLLSCSLDKTVKVWATSESGDLQLMHTHSEEH
ncbi:hypothetical protein ZWY2020_048128 [Hordeum vulgare]|nr:hypothetical protein ZWY2020_048128 [Hordeum vulgare]